MPKTYPAGPHSPPDITTLLTNLPPGSTIALTKLPTGEIAVAAVEEKPRTKEDLLQERYADLLGQPITLSEAAEKYGVPRDTVSKWVYRNNYIGFVDENEYPKTVNEAEVALCSDIYKERLESGLTGVPFFDDDGFIIEERKHEKLAEYRRRKRREKA